MKSLTPLNLLHVLLLSIPFSVAAQVSDLTVTDRHLISKKRVSRNEVEYTYSLTINNTAELLHGVSVTVGSSSNDTQIVEGLVNVGDVPNGDTRSADTFTMRQNRLVLFNPEHLSFTFSADLPGNTAPIADAGVNQEVTAGTVVHLDASASSDADGDALAFAWSVKSIPSGSQAVLDDAHHVAPGFLADLPGTYIFDLVVNDGRVDSAVQSVTVTAHALPESFIACELEPRHIQIPLSSAPAQGASSDDYNPVLHGFLGQILGLGQVSGANLEAFFTDLDGDNLGDLVLRYPNRSSVEVWQSDGNGIFQLPVEYNIGESPLTALAVGNFIGDLWQDIAVANSDGKIEFLEGQGLGAFLHRAEYGVDVGRQVVRLASDDLDGDGDDDLFAAIDAGIVVFLQDNDQVNDDLVKNGDFSLGLSFWQTEVVGEAPNQPAGVVEVVNGRLQLRENASFRTTLKQSFLIPDPPGELAFELLSSALEDPGNGVPDAFEASLLGSGDSSPVPTIFPGATAFLNINPEGAVTKASGVAIDGARVTLDLSGATAGTAVTLYFDLIGNKPGSSSTITLDNVDAGSAITLVNSFTGNDLTGPFNDPRGVGSCDLDGNGLPDIFIHDSGADELLVYSLNPDGIFARSQVISLKGN